MHVEIIHISLFSASATPAWGIWWDPTLGGQARAAPGSGWAPSLTMQPTQTGKCRTPNMVNQTAWDQGPGIPVLNLNSKVQTLKTRFSATLTGKSGEHPKLRIW